MSALHPKTPQELADQLLQIDRARRDGQRRTLKLKYGEAK
jgi:hypothetical protein